MTRAIALVATWVAFALLLWVSWAGAQGLGATRSCGKSAFANISTATTTQIVPTSADRNAGATIFLCGFSITAGGTGNISLEYGSKVSTACDTGATALTPTYSLTAGNSIVNDSALFNGISVPPGNALCAVTSASVAMQVLVYYDDSYE
jgi:hypothetical protein